MSNTKTKTVGAVPEHVDKYTRNQRVFTHLKSLGLVVQPIYVDDDPERIDQLVVSADFPPEKTLMTLEQASALQQPSVT